MTLLIAPGSVELISSVHFDGRCYQLRLFLELRTRGQVETYNTEDAVDFLAVNLSLIDGKCLCFSFGIESNCTKGIYAGNICNGWRLFF